MFVAPANPGLNPFQYTFCLPRPRPGAHPGPGDCSPSCRINQKHIPSEHAAPARFILKMLHRQPLFTQSVPEKLPRDKPESGFAAAHTLQQPNSR